MNNSEPYVRIRLSLILTVPFPSVLKEIHRNDFYVLDMKRALIFVNMKNSITERAK